MIGFNIQTVFYKAKGNSESAIQNQINDLINIVNGFHNISPYIEVWYVNNATSTKPPLDYPFPSEKATKYLYNLRKKDEFEFFDLWNAHVDNESYCDISYSFSGLRT